MQLNVPYKRESLPHEGLVLLPDLKLGPVFEKYQLRASHYSHIFDPSRILHAAESFGKKNDHHSI